MLKYPEVKRAWIVGDIHLGIRAASMDWFDISKIYFEQYLLPLIEKNYKEGDVLIQLGDLFENRQTINLKFNSYAIEIFQRIGKFCFSNISVDLPHARSLLYRFLLFFRL